VSDAGGSAEGPEPSAAEGSTTVESAVELARETFLANERVEMNTLAAQLGIGRATLYRRVGSREELLDEVLGRLAGEFFEPSRAEALTHPDDVVPDLVRSMIEATAGLEALRSFVRREPELALRLLVGRDRSMRRTLVKEVDALRGFAEATVQIGVALVWPTLVAGDEPSGEETARIIRAMLAGARAGALGSAS
jgi:AcrR family transcriptional regulator